MPKLKKQSKIQNKPKNDTDCFPLIDANETQAEDISLSSYLTKPVRMKYSQRMKCGDCQSPKAGIVQDKSLCKKQEESKYLISDDEMELFITKFTDNQDDDISVVQDNTRPPKAKSIKQPKRLLKTSNKLFSDLNFQESLEEQSHHSCQRLEIEIEKKNKKQNGNTMQRIQQRADFYKNKLEYKELAKDHRYKRNIQDKLKSIEDVQEVDIVVEIPKVFGGKNSQVQAALFLRNQQDRQKQKELHGHIISQPDQEETSLPKDRKMYYSQLQKHVKIKKAEAMAPSTLKDCFKKSMLDDQDYICILEDRQGNYQEFIESQHTKSRISDIQKKKSFQEIHQAGKSIQYDQNTHQNNQVPQEVTNEKVQKVRQAKIIQKNQEPVKQQKKILSKPPKQDNFKQQSSSFNLQLKAKKRSNRPKHNRKKSQFSFKDFIEVQAELSDDQENGGPKHQDNQQSQQDDESNISSLIDDDAQQNTSDGYNLRKKFIQDVLQEQQRRYEQIRRKMQQKYRQEEERLNKRMQDAARKNHEKEKEDQVQAKKETVIEQSNTHRSAESSTCTYQKQKNKEKLKQLELMLGQQAKQQKDLFVSKAGQKVGKLQELQLGILHSKKLEYKKPDRNGFKNIQPHKQSTKLFRLKP